MNNESKFTPGDVVMLKCGGSAMVVAQVTSEKAPDPDNICEGPKIFHFVRCHWHDHNGMDQVVDYPATALMPATEHPRYELSEELRTLQEELRLLDIKAAEPQVRQKAMGLANGSIKQRRRNHQQNGR